MSSVSNTFSTAGANTWTCPAGIRVITVECWGAGGAGAYMNANGNGGGGGGGAYARKNAVPVVPGTVYSLVVGTGGNNQNNSNGTASSFNGGSSNVCIGDFGITASRNSTTGQAGGLGANSTGDVVRNGGGGFSPASTTKGGGGGSSAGSWNNGTAATSNTGAVGDGSSGVGGNGSASGNGNGTNGGTPGAGGGGGARTAGNHQGGQGAVGQVKVTYDPQQINNYLFAKGGDGISFTERVR